MSTSCENAQDSKIKNSNKVYFASKKILKCNMQNNYVNRILTEFFSGSSGMINLKLCPNI